MKRWGALVATLLIAGCTASETIPLFPASSPMAGQPLPNLRRILVDEIVKVYPEPTKIRALETAELRPTLHWTGPAWMACLKVRTDERSQNFAVFVQQDKVVDSRLAVLIDNCHEARFQPLVLPTRPDPRPQILKQIGQIFGRRAAIGTVKVSTPRLVEYGGGEAWLVCVSNLHEGALQMVVVFMRNDKIVSRRFAGTVDNCREENMSPLPVPRQPPS